MSIELIIGHMFSGKTTELLRRLNRHKLANKRVLIVKYAQDNRYSENVVCTHDNIKNDNSFSIVNTTDLNVVADYLLLEMESSRPIDVIGIDEGQFYEDINFFCDLWANYHNKKIIISGLNGDYKRHIFENLISLFPICEKITKLTSICRCGNDASFTHRKIKDTKQEIIGGKDIYEPLCRKCFFKFNFA